jgi:hypothetical protein
MKCQKFATENPLGTCPRKASWTVERLPLCTYHARKIPLVIVLSDYVKWGKWIKVQPIPEGARCKHPRGCKHKYGSDFEFDEAGPSEFTVNGGPPLCRYHTELAVWGEALHDNFLSKLISIAPFEPDEVEEESP